MYDGMDGIIEKGLPVSTHIYGVLKLEGVSKVGEGREEGRLDTMETMSLEEGVFLVRIIGEEVSDPFKDFTNVGSKGHFISREVLKSGGIGLQVWRSELGIVKAFMEVGHQLKGTVDVKAVAGLG